MSSGMNLEEANEYAKTMSYRKAVNNIRYAKGIAYKKATWIKLRELAEIADRLVRCGECKHAEKCSQNIALQDTYQMYEKIDFCSYGEREGE